MAPTEDDAHPYMRPRDAATLILVRPGAAGPEVLMGERSDKHVFIPNNYVFPGGRVDRGDGYVAPLAPLRESVAGRLAASCTPRRAQAIALAAVRETFEETGLILGRQLNGAAPPRVPDAWRHFYASGYGPALDRLTYVARAITPPGRPRRFNARFFVADADAVTGEHKDSNELLQVRWLTIEDAKALKNIRPITRLVLDEIASRAASGNLHDEARPVPAWRVVHGKRQVSWE